MSENSPVRTEWIRVPTAGGADGGGFDAFLATPPSGSGPGLLLLHGYGMNSMTWAWLARALRRRGLGPLYTATYFSLQSIERSAARLATLEATDLDGFCKLVQLANGLRQRGPR